MERRMVGTYALALVNRVDYFWGRQVAGAGLGRPLGRADGGHGRGRRHHRHGAAFYGLDCSGFVDWAFYNASGGSYIIGQGGGAVAQHGQCADIPWDEVQPGDLLFYPEDEHVGIAAGRDGQGRLLVVHCAAGAGGVTLSLQQRFHAGGQAGVVWGGMMFFLLKYDALRSIIKKTK